MGDFRSDNRRDNRGGFRGRGGDRERTQMYDAVCHECGKNCQIPFRPSSGKPVYCSDCFEKNGGGRKDRGPRRSGPSRGGSDSGLSDLSRKVEALDAKLDRVIKMLTSKVDEVKEQMQPEETPVVEETVEEVEAVESKPKAKKAKKE